MNLFSLEIATCVVPEMTRALMKDVGLSRREACILSAEVVRRSLLRFQNGDVDLEELAAGETCVPLLAAIEPHTLSKETGLDPAATILGLRTLLPRLVFVLRKLSCRFEHTERPLRVTARAMRDAAIIASVWGVRPEHAELLATAGIDTVEELCGHNPKGLRARLELANAHLSFRHRAPALETVAAWIHAAKRLLSSPDPLTEAPGHP